MILQVNVLLPVGLLSHAGRAVAYWGFFSQLANTGSYLVDEHTPNRGEEGMRMVDFAAGLEKLLNSYPQKYNDLMQGCDNAVDLLIQLSVFGRVKYG